MKRQGLYPNMLSGALTLDSFGMWMRERTYSSATYRFGFNGMEKVNDIFNSVEYSSEYRQLDVRIGRWLSIDPIVQPSQSPYCTFDNNPIYFNDPLGLSTQDPGDGIRNFILSIKDLFKKHGAHYKRGTYHKPKIINSSGKPPAPKPTQIEKIPVPEIIIGGSPKPKDLPTPIHISPIRACFKWIDGPPVRNDPVISNLPIPDRYLLNIGPGHFSYLDHYTDIATNAEAERIKNFGANNYHPNETTGISNVNSRNGNCTTTGTDTWKITTTQIFRISLVGPGLGTRNAASYDWYNVYKIERDLLIQSGVPAGNIIMGNFQVLFPWESGYSTTLKHTFDLITRRTYTSTRLTSTTCKIKVPCN